MTPSLSESSSNRNEFRRIWDAFVSWHTSVDSPHPEVGQGLRMAAGIFVPILVGWVHNHISWGVLVALATFWVLLCDTGGSYRAKAASIAVSTLAIVAAFVFGAWASHTSITHIAGVFVWLSTAAFFGITGNTAAQAGLMSSTMFIVSIALFVPGEFWIRTELCCLGGLWAMVLSLALWPLQSASPVFDALEVSYLKLAELLEAFWSGSSIEGRPINNVSFALAFDSFITQLENTRTIWGAIRARRAGPSTRSIQLLRLIELLDRIGGSTVALRQLAGLLEESVHRPRIISELHSLTANLVVVTRDLAHSIPKRGRALDTIRAETTLKTAEERLETLFAAIDRDQRPFSNPELQSTALNLVRQIRKTEKLIANLESNVDEKKAAAEMISAPQVEPFRFWKTIRNNLSLESDGLRHALRLGVVATFGQALASVLHLPRGYWITVTILFILKPNFGGTLQRAVLRLTGTVGGGLIAAALSLTIREEVILIAILPLLALVALSIRPINYGLYTLALTPMIMVMLDVGHTATWETSFLRVGHTFVGGILAVVGGYLLFPIWEKQKLPGEIVAVLKANADFLRAILASSAEGEKTDKAWLQRQRKAGLSLANATTVGQRVMSEPKHLGSEVESSLAAINDARDIFHILSAIMESRARSQSLADNFRELGLNLADFLDNLAAALSAGKKKLQAPDTKHWEEQLHRGQAPADLSHSPVSDTTQTQWLVTQFEALIESVQALHSAISRLVHGDERSSDERPSPNQGGVVLTTANER
jgi:uncharacterized membrane protein YccC